MGQGGGRRIDRRPVVSSNLKCARDTTSCLFFFFFGPGEVRLALLAASRNGNCADTSQTRPAASWMFCGCHWLELLIGTLFLMKSDPHHLDGNE